MDDKTLLTCAVVGLGVYLYMQSERERERAELAAAVSAPVVAAPVAPTAPSAGGGGFADQAGDALGDLIGSGLSSLGDWLFGKH